MARYEVRVYNLEEWIDENRMTYSPCDDRQDAKRKYAEALDDYNDYYHKVELCRVDYGEYGESVKVLASSYNDNPRRIVWEDDYV